MGEIWQCQFQNWSQRCFDIMTKMNDNVMVRDTGTLKNQNWRKRLHQKELETLMMDIGYAWFIMTHWWYSNKSRIDDMHTYSIRLEKVPLSQRKSMVFSVSSGDWNNSGRKRGGQSSPSCLSDWILLERTRKEKPNSDYTVPQKAPYGASWKRNQDAAYWVRLKEAQDQGLQFWQTKSFAIMTYFTVPGDCIDRVTAQNGHRLLFDRLATPRPAPKVTLRKNWQSQQQKQQPQQPTPHTDAPGIWKQRATWESKAEVQDDSKHISDADPVLGNRQQFTSHMDVDSHLSDKVVTTNALVKNEAVKEELTDTITKAIERINIGSNKICLRQDLAKEKMVFGQESSQAICEMGNVELMELMRSMIRCPSCLHYFFKGTILCRCGESKAAFEVLKAPCFRTSAINARGYKHGPTLWQEHHKAEDALGGCSNNKRQKTSIWDRWQTDDLQGVSTCHWLDRCSGEILGPYCTIRHLPYSAALTKA